MNIFELITKKDMQAIKATIDNDVVKGVVEWGNHIRWLNPQYRMERVLILVTVYEDGDMTWFKWTIDRIDDMVLNKKLSIVKTDKKMGYIVIATYPDEEEINVVDIGFLN